MTPEALKGLTRDALEATAVSDDTRELEPFLFRVLEALREDPGLRDHAVRLFLSELESFRTSIADLLAYCMHDLRWPEIRARCVELLVPEDTERWRRKSADFRDVLAAYEDGWTSRDLYALYDEGRPPTISTADSETVPRGRSVQIDFDDLVVHAYDRNGKTLHRSLSELKAESRHVHGRLTIRIHEQEVPGLGYWGPGDVCMVDWLREMQGISKAFGDPDSGRHTFDEGEQGQPAYVFEREGSRGFLTIADSEVSDGEADPNWHRVQFEAEDLVHEIRLVFARFLGALRAAAPQATDEWMDRWL